MDELVLRPVEEDDLPIFFENERDPEATHMAAFTAKDPNNRAAFDAHWAKVLSNPTVFIRTIVVDSVVIGSVLKWEDEDHPEIAFWISRAYWGRGITTRALAAFLEELTVRPMFARAAADNKGSIRVLEKCGFQYVTTERGFANARGAEIDEVLMRLD